MYKLLLGFSVVLFLLAFTTSTNSDPELIQWLRKAYAGRPATWPTPTIDEGVVFHELDTLPRVVFPAENPYSKEKVALGKKLFFDPRLSQSGTIACASCHDPELGWADGRRMAFGHERRQGKRNAMSILNTAYFETLFWDGRAVSLEEQALFPIQDHAEMNMDLGEMLKNLNGVGEYRQAFAGIYGGDSIRLEQVQQVLATFERTIVSRESAFDRFVKGNSKALSDEALWGLHLFRTKARCINCHNGALFSDNQFHNNGQSHLGRPSEDLGLFLISGDTADVGKFRTPSLRDVVLTGPWLHSGLVFELHEMIELYNNGMPQVIPKKVANSPLYPTKSPLLKPLGLTVEEKHALLAFLESISARPHRILVPELPEMLGK